MLYSDRAFSDGRLITSCVNIGDLTIGGGAPLSIQSMTSTPTMDSAATVAQCIRLVHAGCEIIRITAPGVKEAEMLGVIKKELVRQGYHVPLVADIHYKPEAAEIAAKYIEKVRINPGNYVDKRVFKQVDYTPQQYHDELERIAERLQPLLRVCKAYGTAIRIGTNHGSLSDRIVSRYGDTPEGMAKSAMEFIRICRDADFHQLVLSMKSSNTRVMVQSTRLLVKMMLDEGFCYPLHLGVTEAGNGFEGRVKSAAGIGTLLEEGIGDTLRVSLTEDPECEIPLAKAIASQYNKQDKVFAFSRDISCYVDPFNFKLREVVDVDPVFHQQALVVDTMTEDRPVCCSDDLAKYGYHRDSLNHVWKKDSWAPDLLFTGNRVIDFELPPKLGVITTNEGQLPDLHYKIISHRVLDKACGDEHPLFVEIQPDDIDEQLWRKINYRNNIVVVVNVSHGDGAVMIFREAMFKMMEYGIDAPVIFRMRNSENESLDQTIVHAAGNLAPLFNDGLGNGIWLEGVVKNSSAVNMAYAILQATGIRRERTEFIACPSCGRTRYNIQAALKQVKERTAHLKNLKIAVMGCIVNGPGEMSDADYGYIGAGDGRVNLYKRRQLMYKGVAEDQAIDMLERLIREHGDWNDA